WVGDDLYAFSFDYGEMLADLHTQVLRANQMDESIVVRLVGQGDREPAGVLVRTPLTPYLPHEALVVSARDPDAIARKKAQRWRTRATVIGVAVGMSLLGLVLSARLI